MIKRGGDWLFAAAVIVVIGLCAVLIVSAFQ